MDPTFYLCVGTQPPPLDELAMWFRVDPSAITGDDVPGEAILAPGTARKPNTKGMTTTSYLKNLPVYCDVDLWTALQDQLDKYEHTVGHYARVLNPFEGLDNMSALNKNARAGIKLANIDAVFNVSGHDATYLEPISLKVIKFFDVAGGPGAFSRYLQYRFPVSQGYGISLKTTVQGCAWNTGLLDMRRFTILEGEDGTGDLIKNYEWTINAIQERAGSEGVDVVVADGFIKPSQKDDFRREELINQGLIACECGIGVATVKVGGCLVVKIAEATRPAMAELIYLLAVAFDRVSMFKPISSRPANAEKYLVCMNRRKDVSLVSSLFANYAVQIQATGTFEPILGELPKEFEDQLTAVNNMHLRRQKVEIDGVEKLTNGVSVVRYNPDLHRAFLAWRIPMTSDRVTDPRYMRDECRMPTDRRSKPTEMIEVGPRKIDILVPAALGVDVKPVLPKKYPARIDELISLLGGKEATIKFLDQQIAEGLISFPSYTLFVDKPEVMMDRLRKYRTAPITTKYFLKSYLPKAKLYLPPLFQAQLKTRERPVYIVSSDKDYAEIDILSDHYSELIRLATHRPNEPSTLDFWSKPELRRKYLDELLNQETLDFPTMRAVLYRQTFESKQFRPTWVRGVYNVLNLPPGSRVVDISAGWGDRLLAAMSADHLYTGFDPNPNLTNAYSKMIADFGDPQKHKVHIKPFEDATPAELGNSNDLVFSSPPFFDVEVYPGDEKQSIKRYPKFKEWVEKFLFPSLRKAWVSLKNGGILAIHMGDVKGSLQVNELMNLFIEEKLPGSSWMGIIGVSGEVGSARPVWVWKKTDRVVNRWNPNIKRSLAELYPEIQA